MENSVYHLQKTDWIVTPEGQPRGFIQPETLHELWFHTGTICNLQCPFCLEGSGPGDKRLQPLTLRDARPFLDEALEFSVKQFCFTGGEPFVNKEIINILAYALDRRPCLVLTNGTAPLLKRFAEVLSLRDCAHQLSFRISVDYPDADRHDAGRGEGSFQLALRSLALLHQNGFRVSVARRAAAGEDSERVTQRYRRLFAAVGLPEDVPMIVFPELFPPNYRAEVPHITENCMTTYKNAQTRAQFMCHYSKMVVKKAGKVCVYPCTLVDDDDDYKLGSTLEEAMRYRVMLKHHRCYACFSCGASCSEL